MQAFNTKRMKIYDAISGALYDFMAYITTQNDFYVGATSDVVPLLEHFKRWSSDRGLNVNTPDRDWKDKL